MKTHPLIKFYWFLARESLWKTIPLLLITSAFIVIPIVIVIGIFDWEDKFVTKQSDFNLLGVISLCFVAPFLETLIFQGLILKVTRFFTKKISLQILISSFFFGVIHNLSLLYMLYAFLGGLVFAFGFSAYQEEKGFSKALWGITVVHGLRNLLSFL